MIITKLSGGLGNQMFQYSIARVLSLELNLPLRIDVTAFKGTSLHQGFELNKVFFLNTNSASNQDFYYVLGWQGPRIVRTVVNSSKILSLRKKNWVKELNFFYCHEVFEISDKVFLDGYWQSERYFNNKSDVIRGDFQFQGVLEGVNLLLKENIDNSNSVSVHIRRGDYIFNSTAAKIHGKCSLGYYEKAMGYMFGKVDNPVFFIFSDDPQWVKDNLNVNNYSVFYVDNNCNENSYKDMWLMSLCKHNIIANSTFSWWGAWLNNNVNKNIIAPKLWFADPSKQEQAFDIYPEGWIKL